MVFSLEALRAKQGDCLLLWFGEAGGERLIVIDGGPSGVYKEALEPRLEALRAAAGGPLEIELMMVSHIDEDHVNGVLDFSQDLIEDEERAAGYRVRTLWLNSFEDLVADAGGVAAAEQAGDRPPNIEAVIASVNEGRRLRDNARGLKWKENDGFERFVMAAADGGAVPDLDLAPLKLTVVGPRQAELDDLRQEWKKKVEELREKGELDVAAADIDDSVPNLSSIVCLAELDAPAGTRSMLLTGDALGKRVLEGLEDAGLLAAGGAMDDLDLLKVPHHGSSRNVDVDFFERLPARHLVISANGRHHNPDLTTLEMIATARPEDEFTIHFTETEFKSGMRPQLEETIARHQREGRRYEAVFPPAEQALVRVDLLD